jgi:hypothetical protein
MRLGNAERTGSFKIFATAERDQKRHEVLAELGFFWSLVFEVLSF